MLPQSMTLTCLLRATYTSCSASNAQTRIREFKNDGTVRASTCSKIFKGQVGLVTGAGCVCGIGRSMGIEAALAAAKFDN
jgi:hypothetical protein